MPNLLTLSLDSRLESSDLTVGLLDGIRIPRAATKSTVFVYGGNSQTYLQATPKLHVYITV